MGVYVVRGGRPLSGSVSIHGAKNSVLPILAATLVRPGRYSIENCPDISDVQTALEILCTLGCRAQREGETIHIDTQCAVPRPIPPALMGKMRAAVLFLGALLARFGEAELSQPGGCPLGARPIDLHLMGLRQLGAQCVWEDGILHCRAQRLRGCTISLLFPSVGATENLLLAALGCHGSVTLCNAAREPEITDLVRFLQTCGAKIGGQDGSVLTVEGGSMCRDGAYRVMPDRMEAASYLALGAATRSTLELKRVCPQQLTAVTSLLSDCGCEIREQGDRLLLRARGLRAAGPVVTGPYPAFPTDAQAPVMAAMATAEGSCVFEERVFPERFHHCNALRTMGARIYHTRRYAVVQGVARLHGANVAATDLRGGAAMVIAALSAEGESRISQTGHMERGYAALVETLQACGGDIIAEEG